MKKIFLIFILLIAILALTLWFLKEPVMSVYLSKKLKTEVSVGNVKLSKSQMKIKNLKIPNPSGFRIDTAFTCDEMLVLYKFDELKKDPLVIDKIDLNNSYIHIDCKNALCTNNNWTHLMKSVSDKELQMKEGKEVVVRKVSMNDLNVEIHGLGLIPGITKKVNIKHLDIDNVTSKDGFPTGQLIVAIFKEAGIFEYIKSIVDTHKIFDNYFKSKTPFGLNEEPSSVDAKEGNSL